MGIAYCLAIHGVENYDKIALSPTVKEIENRKFCALPLLAKMKKLKMATIFENFLQSGYTILLRYSGVKNFDEIALYLYLVPLRRYRQCCNFAEIQKLKMVNFIILKYFLRYWTSNLIFMVKRPLGLKFKGLSRTLKEIQAMLCFCRNSKIQNGKFHHFKLLNIKPDFYGKKVIWP